MEETISKIVLNEKRLRLTSDHVNRVLTGVFMAVGFSEDISDAVSSHLIDANLVGVESHGIMRVLEYVAQAKSGYLNVSGRPELMKNDKNFLEVNANGGIGIPAFNLAYDECCKTGENDGLSIMAIKNVGHTGRLGAYAEAAGKRGFLTICMGGGNRQTWRQVAPHGGAKAMLPTNPWCIGIPAGQTGPVVLDFATSKIAGGWIYAAKSAGALLPDNCVIDADGEITRDPEDYFSGGAILPAAEHKGFGLALIAELVGEALLGPSTTECHWLLFAIKVDQFREKTSFERVADEILDELRSCPPAPGSSGVHIPGERERIQRELSQNILQIPVSTWDQICDLASKYGVSI
ncbi:MAG: Ldh family oxidoreductase, partial [Rhodobacteraceae bacterium]|nr:Ldh family oxidoreductase [Paracoccaceae bacterium]